MFYSYLHDMLSSDLFHSLIKASMSSICYQKYPGLYNAPKIIFPHNLLPKDICKNVMQYETNFEEFENFYNELVQDT